MFPGARNLFLKFDPRCASQYDYDKVIIYAGDSSKASKVAEYGGNTYGYGSRSVLGGGWPSQSVKVCVVLAGSITVLNCYRLKGTRLQLYLR